MSTQSSDLTLSGASSAAMEFLNSPPSSGDAGGGDGGGNQPESVGQAPSGAPQGVAPSAVAAGQGQAQNAQTPAQQETLAEGNLPDTTKVKLGDGSEITLGELRQGHLRHADYTRKTQELAQQRTQFTTALQQAQRELQDREAQTMAWLQQEQNVIQLAEKITGKPIGQILQALQTPQVDPNEIATVGQAQHYAQQQVVQMQAQLDALKQEFERRTQEQIQQATSELQTRNEAAQYTTKINSTVASLFEEHPILNAVEGMEDVLRFKVYQRQPANVDEALSIFKEEASKQATKLESQFQELQKTKIANKEKLLSGGIEPPGGGVVQQQPKTFKSLKDPNLQDAVGAYLKQHARNR